ncbi:MAG TPA: ABC transporter ATP-binding protein [Anaerovoracaceae bacterium]|nr:ABC transporter ATP-binding protein [Anaerovoracaceae bacterium]
MKLLEVKNLKTYFDTSKGQLKAVDDVSFDLEYGEALGLVGESGCGKTTSALSICKLLPKEGQVYGGQILLEGQDLAKLSDDEIREHRWKDVSIIFQGAMNALNPVMNIGGQISEAIILHEKVSKEEALKRAGDLLELVEIPRERVSQYPHEFSGGMKQRVMIAMALACNPKVVIGDEPTTALDVMVQAQILNLLEKLRKELNMGLILITHDLSILGETCDKIAVMYAGKIMEIGTVEDIFEHAQHPYTKKLISCFPNIEKEKVIPDGIDGTPPNMLEPPTGCTFHPRCPMATDKCRTEAPVTKQLGEKHFAYCHFVEVNHG